MGVSWPARINIYIYIYTGEYKARNDKIDSFPSCQFSLASQLIFFFFVRINLAKFSNFLAILISDFIYIFLGYNNVNDGKLSVFAVSRVE